jgi:hypothetical protein
MASGWLLFLMNSESSCAHKQQALHLFVCDGPHLSCEDVLFDLAQVPGVAALNRGG